MHGNARSNKNAFAVESKQSVSRLNSIINHKVNKLFDKTAYGAGQSPSQQFPVNDRGIDVFRGEWSLTKQK